MICKVSGSRRQLSRTRPHQVVNKLMSLAVTAARDTGLMGQAACTADSQPVHLG